MLLRITYEDKYTVVISHTLLLLSFIDQIGAIWCLTLTPGCCVELKLSLSSGREEVSEQPWYRGGACGWGGSIPQIPKDVAFLYTWKPHIIITFRRVAQCDRYLWGIRYWGV